MFLTTCFFPPTNAYMSPIMDQTDFHPKASRAASRSCKRHFVRDSVITIPFPLSAFFLAYISFLWVQRKNLIIIGVPLTFFFEGSGWLCLCHLPVKDYQEVNCYLIYHKYNFHIQGTSLFWGHLHIYE